MHQVSPVNHQCSVFHNDNPTGFHNLESHTSSHTFAMHATALKLVALCRTLLNDNCIHRICDCLELDIRPAVKHNGGHASFMKCDTCPALVLLPPATLAGCWLAPRLPSKLLPLLWLCTENCMLPAGCSFGRSSAGGHLGRAGVRCDGAGCVEGQSHASLCQAAPQARPAAGRRSWPGP